MINFGKGNTFFEKRVTFYQIILCLESFILLEISGKFFTFAG
jgi:hypothetical protein